jgi:signal-transduction protein with cAMP-binding, CBS, and nucleotidyltransferase domain
MMEEKFTHRDFLYLKKDDYFFEAGESADGIFCIYTGKAYIFNEEKNIIQTATDGDTIGYNSIIGDYYINSAKAAEDCFCCFLKLSEVQQLIKDN